MQLGNLWLASSLQTSWPCAVVFNQTRDFLMTVYNLTEDESISECAWIPIASVVGFVHACAVLM